VAVPLDFLRRSVGSLSLRLQKSVQNAGAYVEILTLYGSVCTLT
jgi:hypothetical protein